MTAVECKDDNCRVKSHWFEQIGGKWFLCYNQRHHGRKHVVKIPVEEIERKIKEAH